MMHSRQLLWVHIYNTEELQKLKDQLEEFGELTHTVLPAESLSVFWERAGAASKLLAHYRRVR